MVIGGEGASGQINTCHKVPLQVIFMTTFSFGVYIVNKSMVYRDPGMPAHTYVVRTMYNVHYTTLVQNEIMIQKYVHRSALVLCELKLTGN